MPVPEIILASRSKARVEMLTKVGLQFQSIPADIDEDTISKNINSADNIADELAARKALHIGNSNPKALVIGSDQVLECDGKILSKAKDKKDAIEKLKFLRGKTHRLVSAAAIAKDNKIIWSYRDEAKLTMKNFDDEFLNTYAEKSKEVLTTCVGAYALEEHGAWLFQKIEGDYFTILGMPLLPLLSFLQEQGVRP